jgi:hypothetical protein
MCGRCLHDWGASEVSLVGHQLLGMPSCSLPKIEEVEQGGPVAGQELRRCPKRPGGPHRALEEEARVEERFEDGPRDFVPPLVVLELEGLAGSLSHDLQEPRVQLSVWRERLDGRDQLERLGLGPEDLAPRDPARDRYELAILA